MNGLFPNDHCNTTVAKKNRTHTHTHKRSFSFSQSISTMCVPVAPSLSLFSPSYHGRCSCTSQHPPNSRFLPRRPQAVSDLLTCYMPQAFHTMKLAIYWHDLHSRSYSHHHHHSRILSSDDRSTHPCSSVPQESARQYVLGSPFVVRL